MRITELTFDKTKIGFRDAFHVPAVAVVSRENLKPGTFVRFVDNEMTEVRSVEGAEIFHGIVDPFVDCLIEPGVVFYVLVHPDMSKNLRHDFTIDMESAKTQRVWTEQDEEDDEWLNDSCRGCY